ncbi:hypothetical protein NE237_002276 [Protea cynaroides]|uniref:Cytochrome P450 n=1 Tax=Protea cynaroides TaxID=273540 RepID=A0A9Q0QYW1_9MAGN|nr:hypothetical protein NE237_002276 [Protea cynaroides]
MEVLCCLIFCLSVFLVSKLVLQQKQHLPPAPIALPILGHLHLLKKSLHRKLEALASHYGPIFRLQLGSRSVLVVSSPSAIEECFTKNDIILSNRPYSVVGEHLGYNCTTIGWSSYGQHWRNLRRFLVIQMFSSNSLQTSSDIRNREVSHLVRQLYRGSDGELQKVELKSIFFQLTLNIVMGMVAGKRLFGDEEVDVELREQFLNIMKERYSNPSMNMSILDYLPILRWVGFQSEEKKMVRFNKKRDAFFQGLIDQRRRRMSDSTKVIQGDSKKTLVDAALSLQQAEPEYYSDDIIKGLILVAFTAGIETSLQTMEWAMSLLLNHPEELQKAREEIDNNVGQGRLIEESDLAKLPYLRGIVNETLRLFPVAPLLVPHMSSEECSIEGYDVPRGTVVLVNAWAVHRDPKLWLEPTSFKPERFQGIEGEREGYKFIPFGLGRRGCPGAGMGIRMVSLALGALIQCFDWVRIGSEKVDLSEADHGLSMPKAKPLEALYVPRPTMINLYSQL